MAARGVRWQLLAASLAVLLSTAALIPRRPPDDWWLTTVLGVFFASICAGTLVVAMIRWPGRSSLPVWTPATLVGAVMASTLVYHYDERWNARVGTYQGRYVVTGAEYTAHGTQWTKTHSTDVNSLLFDAGGNAEIIWTRDSIEGTKRTLRALYVVGHPLLAVSLLLAAQTIGCGVGIRVRRPGGDVDVPTLTAAERSATRPVWPTELSTTSQDHRAQPDVSRSSGDATGHAPARPTTPRTIRIFLSSPSDVSVERQLARDVIVELERGHLLRGKIRFDVVAWDDGHASTPMDARESPQESVNRYTGRPADCDLTIVILWSRLGTPVPAHVRHQAGATPETGSVWEFHDARDHGKPVFVYRRTQPPQSRLDDPDLDTKRARFAEVKRFFDSFRSPDGSLRIGANEYSDPADFRGLLRQHLEAFISEQLSLEILGTFDVPERQGPSVDRSSVVGPNLLPIRVAVERRALITVGAPVPPGSIDCAIVVLRNDPKSTQPTAEAASVLAQITFVCDGVPVLVVNTARWGDTDQPAIRKAKDPFASLIDLNTVPFRIGESHELNVAIKHPHQAHFYACDNSTYDYENWENPGYRLEHALYRVVVRLRGVHLDQEHHFILRNLGAGSGLELASAEG